MNWIFVHILYFSFCPVTQCLHVRLQDGYDAPLEPPNADLLKNLDKSEYSRLMTSQKVSLARSFVEGIRAAQQNTSLQLEFEKKPQKGVFCFFFCSSPAEPTAELLLDQLRKGCDDYAAFSNTHQTFGEHEVIEAFSNEELKEGLTHQMHFMMKNSWKTMAGMGVLGKYDWYVKFDSDSFVQSSSVRKTFSRYSADNTIISIGHLSGTPVDGFLVGLPNSFLQKVYGFMQSQDNQARVCDEFVSGHSEQEDLPPTDYQKCAEEVGNFDVQDPEDEDGNALLLTNQEVKGRRNGCRNIAFKSMEHFDHTSAPLCDCKPVYSWNTKCYSRDFMTMHPVKDPATYKELMKRFP